MHDRCASQARTRLIPPNLTLLSQFKRSSDHFVDLDGVEYDEGAVVNTNPALAGAAGACSSYRRHVPGFWSDGLLDQGEQDCQPLQVLLLGLVARFIRCRMSAASGGEDRLAAASSSSS